VVVSLPSFDRNLSLLFIVNTIVAVYWNVTRTFIPLFVRSLEASVFQVSLVIFVGGLAATSVMIPSGLLCDRYGRRRMIILGTAFLFVSPLLYTLADSWEETILCYLTSTVAFSLFTPARMTMIADSIKPGSLGRAYGLMNLAWPIGGIAGPFLGGFIADNYGWTAFFYSLCAIAFMCIVLSLFLGESITRPRDEEEKTARSPFKKEVVVVLMVFLVIHILGNSARGILGTVFPFYLTEHFGKSKTETGIFFSIGFGLATLITQLPSGLLADRLGRKKTMVYSVSLIPILPLLFPLTSDYFSTLLVYMALSGLWSATWPASSAYLMDISKTSRRGIMMGVRLTAVRLGFTVGPVIGGFLWETYAPAISFYATAVFFAASFILILLLRE
jgi:MFS family permease